MGEGRLERFGGAGIAETFDLARDSGSPVSASYASPFAFNGKVDRVTIELE